MKIMFNVFIFLIFIAKLQASVLFEDSPYLRHIKNDVYFRDYSNPYFNQTVNYLKFLSTNHQINSVCRSSLQRWINGIENYEYWALKFLESTGKTINGKLTGRHSNFGSFDFCVGFNRNSNQQIDFDGKYCFVSVQTPDSIDIKQFQSYQNYQTKLSERSKRLIEFNLGNGHGVCIPSTCDMNEISSVFNQQFESHGFSIIPPKKCTTVNEPEPLTQLQIVSFSIFGIFILFVILAHFFETDFLSNFSMANNYRIIYCNLPKVKDESSETSLILHGLKALLVILSTAFHSFFPYIIFLVYPISSVRETNLPSNEISNLNLTTFLKLFCERIHLIADQLFFFGGFYAFFAWYTILKKKKTLSMNFLPFFIGRYLRVAITVTPAILIYFLLPALGFGPLFSDLTNHFSDNCKEGFHYIFLLIGYKQPAVDMIYILNYFLIFYLIARPTIGFLLTIAQMIIFSIITLVYFRKLDEIPTFFTFAKDYKSYDLSTLENLYFNLYTHYNTYVMGVVCAYLVQNKIRPKIFMNKFIYWLTWLLVSALALFVFSYPHYLQITNSLPNPVIEFLYPVIDKIFVTSWLFWLFYSLLSGYSDFAKPIFTLAMWVPISRMSFSIIVGQFIYLAWQYPTLRVVHSVNFVTMIKEVAACLVFSFLMANFIFFFFEAPLISIMKKYFALKTRHEKCEKLAQKEANSLEINNNLDCKPVKV